MTDHLYLVLAIRAPDFSASAGDDHQMFLSELIGRGMIELTGPFTDGTGGAYLLRAPSLEEATQIAHTDPLHVSGSSRLTVHEWRVRRFS